MVWQVANAVKVPIIGMGGIMNTEDALEFMLAGASAIAVGTANFINPSVAVTVAQGMEHYLKQEKLTHISQVIGQLKID